MDGCKMIGKLFGDIFPLFFCFLFLLLLAHLNIRTKDSTKEYVPTDVREKCPAFFSYAMSLFFFFLLFLF